MSNEADPNARRLSIDDPIEPAILQKFADLENARMRLGTQLLDLEAEKVKIMIASRQVDVERQRTFEKVLTDRGVAPSTPVEIDAGTGKIRLLTPQQPPGVPPMNGQGDAPQPSAAAPAS